MNNLAKTFPIFSAWFALIYIISVELNWALYTYHPKIGQFGWLVEPSRDGPPMYWYGWLVTSTLGATAVSATALPLLKNRPTQYGIGWIVSFFVKVSVFYFLRRFFLR